MIEKKLSGIQIARAVAALSVAYFHSWNALVRFPAGTSYPLPILADYGFLGVDLFFAISGFVIGMVASRPGFDRGSFLIRRIFRLYPVWLLMLTLFAVLALIWRAPTETETLGYFLYSATLLPTREFPYYDLGWTLQHEMAFYALAAIVVPIFGLRGVAGALAVSSLIYYCNLDVPWFVTKFAKYHAEFLAGLLAFLSMQFFMRIGFLIPFLIGVGSAIFFMTVAGDRPALPISLFFLIGAFANLPDSQLGRRIASVGDASYSIYLLHPLVFIFPKSLTKFISLPIWSQEPIRFACLATVVVVSLFSWRYFERPFIRIGSSVAASWQQRRSLHAPDPAIR